MTKITFYILATALIAIASPAGAACCFLDGNTGTCLKEASGAARIQSNDELGGVICGRTVTGAGCTLEIFNDATQSTNAGCLTVGRGVTVEGNGHNFTCSTTTCATALRLYEASGPGSGVTNVENLNIVGNWAYGIDSDVAGTSNATDINMDGADRGIFDVTNITRATIFNAIHVGIQLSANGATITDSLVRDSGTGATVVGTVTATKLINVLLTDNTWNFSPDPAKIESQGSVIQNATDRNCTNSTNIYDCMTFGGTRVSFVDDTLR
jgi:hypothetical protein